MQSSEKSSVEVSEKDFKRLERMVASQHQTIRAQNDAIATLKRQVQNLQGSVTSLQTSLSRLR